MMKTGNKTEGRHEKIRAMLIANTVVSLGEFCSRLKCSESTIRNDLKALEEQGLITRTFGGAVANENTKYNISMSVRLKLHIEEKRRIAHYIVNKVLEEGCTISIDAGTTNAEIAKAILESSMKLTVITNSLTVSSILGKSGNIALYLSGGQYHPQKDAFIDAAAVGFIRSMRSDIFFLSCDGIDSKEGISISDPEETYIKQTMMACAKKTFCAADSSKIGEVALKIISPLNGVNALVTDARISKDQIRDFNAAGLSVLISGETAAEV